MRGRDTVANSDDASHPPHHNHPAPYVGVHIRKGDRRPAAFFFYPGETIPSAKYVTAARESWDKFYGNASSSASSPASIDAADVGDAHEVDLSSGHEDTYPAPPVMWLASDSPTAVREFTGNFSAATAIFSLNASANAELRALAPTREYVQGEFEQEPEEERVRLTRGMVVDLAMLSGFWAYPGEAVPGAIVCAEG